MMMGDVSAKLVQSMRVRCAFGVRSMRENDDDARGTTIFICLSLPSRASTRRRPLDDVDSSSTIHSSVVARPTRRSIDRSIDRAGLVVSKLRSIS